MLKQKISGNLSERERVLKACDELCGKKKVRKNGRNK